MSKKPKYVFYVQSMVASKTGGPAVTVNGADFTVNMTIEEAVDLAGNLLNAAASAQNDAFFFFEYLHKKLGLSERAIAATLTDFREWKEEGMGLLMQKGWQMCMDEVRAALGRSGDIDLTECIICGKPCFVECNDGQPCCSQCGESDR